MNTQRRTAARAILADFRRWYLKKYGSKTVGKQIVKHHRPAAR